MTKNSGERFPRESRLPEREKWYRFLYEFAPIALAEGDCRELRDHLERLGKQGIKDFHDYFERHPDAVLECLEKIRLTDVNGTMVHMLKAKSKEQVRGGMRRIFTEDSFDTFRLGLIAYAQGQSGFECETAGRAFDGERRYFIMRWTFLPGFEASRDRTLGSFQDITERRRIEEALRENEERFRTLFEFAPDGYYMNDTKGMLIDGNKAAEAMSGYSRTELIGKNILEIPLLLSRQIPRAVLLLTRSAAGQPTGPDEFTLMRKDGSTVPIEVRSVPIRLHGKMLVLSIARDISQRRQAQEELRKFKTISDQANVGNGLFDLDGNIMYANEALAHMHGYSVEEVLGKHYSIFHTDDQLVETNRLTNELRRLGAMGNIEVWHKKKDGRSFPMLVNATVIKDQNGEPLYGAVSGMDISNLKQTEAVLKEREKDLEAKNVKLKEMNAALKILLSNRESDEAELKERVLANVKELAMPVLKKLRGCRLDARQKAYADVLESALQEITSPLMRNLSSRSPGLTRTEQLVIKLVKEGKNAREIAAVMNISRRSVDTYRTRLRKKLGIGGQKINLRTYLLSFS